MSKILIDEATVKLALDALEALVERATPWDGLAWVNGREAITALKALAEQPAQPLTYCQECMRPNPVDGTDCAHGITKGNT